MNALSPLEFYELIPYPHRQVRPMAKRKSTKKPKALPDGNGAGSIKPRIKALRDALTKHFGKLPEAHFARLMGTSTITLGNWETGATPRGKSLEKIQELEAKVASGKLADLPTPPKRGRKTGGAVSRKASPGPKPGKPGRKPKQQARVSVGGAGSPELLSVVRSMLEYALASDDPKPRVQAAIQFIDGEA